MSIFHARVVPPRIRSGRCERGVHVPIGIHEYTHSRTKDLSTTASRSFAPARVNRGILRRVYNVLLVDKV